jgi:nucleoside 2-deoxyribosyltransferase
MKIYLAGPDVFLPDAIDLGRRKAEICTRYGLIGLFPLDNTVDMSTSGASLRIFRGNEAMMNEADAIIANLTPFRGPSADAGTVYELGYVVGRGRFCLGYSNDPSPYAERVGRISKVGTKNGRLTDAQGMTVEDFGLTDNLMLIHVLELHGYPLIVPEQKPADVWHDLTVFEACVSMAAERLACSQPASD